MAKTQPPLTVVVGNEKGGAGKSTIAIHLATALLHQGARVAVLDLDLRQQSLGRFFANRAARFVPAAEWVNVAGCWLKPTTATS